MRGGSRRKSNCRGTGSAVVLPGNYLKEFRLRVWPALWKACGIAAASENTSRQISVTGLTGLRFSAPKILNSNQLYNSLGINTIWTWQDRAFSRFRDLHISGLKRLGDSKFPGARKPRRLQSLSSPTFRTARKASCGISTRPIRFIRFLPSFCFSSSLRLREISPP